MNRLDLIMSLGDQAARPSELVPGRIYCLGRTSRCKDKLTLTFDIPLFKQHDPILGMVIARIPEWSPVLLIERLAFGRGFKVIYGDLIGYTTGELYEIHGKP